MSLNLTRAQRLDDLPYTRRHNKLLFGSGIGWALDAMDIGLISFIMAALAAEWGLGRGSSPCWAPSASWAWRSAPRWEACWQTASGGGRSSP